MRKWPNPGDKSGGRTMGTEGENRFYNIFGCFNASAVSHKLNLKLFVVRFKQILHKLISEHML